MFQQKKLQQTETAGQEWTVQIGYERFLAPEVPFFQKVVSFTESLHAEKQHTDEPLICTYVLGCKDIARFNPFFPAVSA